MQSMSGRSDITLSVSSAAATDNSDHPLTSHDDPHLPSDFQDSHKGALRPLYTQGETSPCETSEVELTTLSERDYPVRVSDPNDFPCVWESLVSTFATLLSNQLSGDFAINVFTYPEASSKAIPRVIYITSEEETMDSALEEEITASLVDAIPPKFDPIYLKFEQGRGENIGWRYVLVAQPLSQDS
jgi:hypothetical protein